MRVAIIFLLLVFLKTLLLTCICSVFFMKNAGGHTRSWPKKPAFWQTFSRQNRGVQIGPCKLNVTFEMGPLQETVTWYKNHLAGWKKAQWDLEKKGYELFEWGYLFVFLALLRRLPLGNVVFLYNVTVSCKESIGYMENGREKRHYSVTRSHLL